MKIYVASENEIAKMAAQRYVQLLNVKSNAVLGFATGSTPIPLYKELAKQVKQGNVSFKNVTSFNLDEYAGLDGTHDQSYRYFMNKQLFKNIDIDVNNTFVPSGINTKNPEIYDAAIQAAGGIDVQLLGIGLDGHIGFNEPGTKFDSQTHLIKLTQSTREANSRFFKSIDEVPTHAVTMGIKTVMNARSIIMIATGESKAEIIAKAINGPITEAVPASILQLHPFVTVYVDYAAAKLL